MAAYICGLCTIATLFGQTRTPDVHFTPTRHAIVDAMLTLAQVTAEDVVYDLGSGDGRIPIIAAQKYGARGVGIEIDPRLIALARQHAREGGVEDNVTFVEGDLFTADITHATVVTLYLSASMNARLEAKLKRELRPGARIVSHQFPIGHWIPDERTRVDFSELFLWRIKPEGHAHESRCLRCPRNIATESQRKNATKAAGLKPTPSRCATTR